MITLVLDAKRIPDGTTVRKVTGTYEYTLKREVKIYMPGDTRAVSVEGMVFLLGETNINGYPENTKFAVDMKEEDALEFLKDLTEEST